MYHGRYSKQNNHTLILLLETFIFIIVLCAIIIKIVSNVESRNHKISLKPIGSIRKEVKSAFKKNLFLMILAFEIEENI